MLDSKRLWMQLKARSNKAAAFAQKPITKLTQSLLQQSHVSVHIHTVAKRNERRVHAEKGVIEGVCVSST